MALSRKQQLFLIPGDVVVLRGFPSSPEVTDVVTITNVVSREGLYYANGKPYSPLIQWTPREQVARDWTELSDGKRVGCAKADASFVSSVERRAPRVCFPLPITNVYARRDPKGEPVFSSKHALYHRRGNHAAMDLCSGATAVLSTVPNRTIDFINAEKLNAAWVEAGRPGARGVYMIMTGEIRPNLEHLTGWKKGETRSLSEAACWWIHVPTLRRWLLRNLGRLCLNKAELRAESIAMAKEEERIYNENLDAFFEQEDDDSSDYEGPDWGVEDPDTYEDDHTHCALCENTNGHSLSCPSISKRNVIEHEGALTLGDILERALKNKEETDGEAR